MRIILASNSPRRKEILSQLGIKYETISSEYEEKAIDTEPEELVMRFSEGKAMSIAKNIKEEALVIGSDTIVYKDGKILGKPKDEEDAYDMLKSLSGVFHTVISGISVIRTPSLHKITTFEKTAVKFKELTEDEIHYYISTKEPMDKAGAYAIQGIGSLLVEKINGCYFNVMGLPVYKLSKVLEDFGYKLLQDR
jgi:septum formation protein